MIDCDIHKQIGDSGQFLEYVSPRRREWLRSMPMPVAHLVQA